jgi:hypothetical protein
MFGRAAAVVVAVEVFQQVWDLAGVCVGGGGALLSCCMAWASAGS